MKSKILSSQFTKIWGTGANTTYFHNLTLDNQEGTVNIGAKAQSPAFLNVGQELEWEWKDQTKGSIKKFSPKPGTFAPATSPAPAAFSATSALEIKLSTAMISATILLAAGKITAEKFNDTVALGIKRFEELKATLV